MNIFKKLGKILNAKNNQCDRYENGMNQSQSGAIYENQRHNIPLLEEVSRTCLDCPSPALCMDTEIDAEQVNNSCEILETGVDALTLETHEGPLLGDEIEQRSNQPLIATFEINAHRTVADPEDAQTNKELRVKTLPVEDVDKVSICMSSLFNVMKIEKDIKENLNNNNKLFIDSNSENSQTSTVDLIENIEEYTVNMALFKDGNYVKRELPADMIDEENDGDLRLFNPLHDEIEVKLQMLADDLIEKEYNDDLGVVMPLNRKAFEVNPQESQETLDDLTSIYVDATLLKQIVRTGKTDVERESGVFVYEINGSVFEDIVTNNFMESDLVEFEVKRVADYDTTDESEYDEESYSETSELPLTVENTPYGLLINSSVVVSSRAWNTVVEATCQVCGLELKQDQVEKHIVSVAHCMTLLLCRPLAKYDMNIVRAINGKYHCAICNIMFEDFEHMESEEHKENMLASTRKASDSTYATTCSQIGHNENKNLDNDARKSRNDCIGYNSTVDSSFFDNDIYDGVYCDFINKQSDVGNRSQSTISYADAAKKPKIFETSDYVEIRLRDRYARVTFDCWHMIMILQTNFFYCMACKMNGPIRFKPEHCLSLNHVDNLMKCYVVEDFKEHLVRKVDNKLYHCGHCNNLRMAHEINHHVQTAHVKRKIRNNDSRSTVIRSPHSSETITADGKSNGYVDNENCKQIANPNSVVNNNNQTYTNNYSSMIAGHDQNINMINNAPGGHMLIGDNRNINNETHLPGACNSNANTPIFVNQWFNESHFVIGPTEGDTIIINFLGLSAKVSLLAYHLIHQETLNEYFCWVCDAWYGYDVMTHIRHPVHVTIINSPQAMFLPQTGIHLIRQMKYSFNCVICNIFTQVDPIAHTWDPMHSELLKRALCINPQPSMSHHHLGTLTNQNRIIQPNPVVPNTVNETHADLAQINVKEDENVIENNDNTDDDKINKDVVDYPAKQNVENINMDTVINKKLCADDTDKENEKIENNDSSNDNKIVYNVAIENNEKITEVPTTKSVITEPFDAETFVYIKIKNVCRKVSALGYHSLVPTGAGARYCAVCGEEAGEERAHVGEPRHVTNLQTYRFLEKYEKHLLRKMPLCYHCALCNVCFTERFLPDHLGWPPHVQRVVRCHDIRAGAREIECTTTIQDTQLQHSTHEHHERSTRDEIRNSGNDDTSEMQSEIQCGDDNYIDVTKKEKREVQCLDTDNAAEVSTHPDSKNSNNDNARVTQDDIRNSVDDATCVTETEILFGNDNDGVKCSTQDDVKNGAENYTCTTEQAIQCEEDNDRDSKTPQSDIRNSGNDDICITQKEIEPIESTLDTDSHVNRSTRDDVKIGGNDVKMTSQKEIVDNNSGFKILVNIEFRPREFVLRKQKTIIVNDSIQTLQWDSYQGIQLFDSAYKCILCQTQLQWWELSVHTESPYHVRMLEDTFLLEYLPNLIRKVRFSLLHCVTCNVEISALQLLATHLAGKRHRKRSADAAAPRRTADRSGALVLTKKSNCNSDK